jgi:hydroxymethylglutaryl-CoA synthase
VYIPKLRIKRDEYQKAWGYFSSRVIEEKSVAGFDEDAVTMGVEAASNALRNGEIDASAIDSLYFASTSAPYVEKQNATTVATAIGCRGDTSTLDVASSIRSGTSALLASLDLVRSDRGKSALAVAADCPLSEPSSALEHQLGAAAAALMIGQEKIGALVEDSFSVASETFAERFRRDGQSQVRTVDIAPYYDAALVQVVTSCVSGILQKLGRSPDDYSWLVLQGLEDARALEISKKLGFGDSKTAPAMISAKIGDAGAASSLLALSKALEKATSGQHVLVCSYGPGTGADALSLAVQREMKPRSGLGYEDYLSRKEYIDYVTYLKLRRFLMSS